MFGLDIAALTPGLHTFELTPAAEDLDLDPEAFTDVAVEARLDHGAAQTLVTVEVRAAAALVCDRTLEPFTQVVSGRHAVLFVEPHRIGSQTAAGSDEVRPLPDPGLLLDLTDVVRDTLLLALPARRVAPGAEARDIPLVFGADCDEGRPVDPRWEALRGLRDDF